MLRIRTLSVAAGALALGTVPALPADFSFDQPTLAAAPGFTWTGPYLGAIAGYGWGQFNVDRGIGSSAPNVSGFKLGAYAGYNFEMGNNVVLGVEGDVNWDNLNGDYLAVTSNSVSQDWDSTLRARAGYSFGRVLAYGTGGLAVTGATLDTAGFSSSNTHWGWTLGAGAEAAVTSNITARLEYQYADYGTEFYQTGLGSGANVDFNTSTIRAGIGYKF
ncbi:MAG: porin family protein [Rhizobiales bacterium]|nr:porin family protein [Hyphomicrobiales bacterium]